ncbi:hypothetical protein CEUSTIGMA_g13024.t1 [Chlamydomonas eustigma]|uniref:Uncharacterized protein n=1 Tax=Chlamydomonas eustigma TaxID=1157962 RepID=A0A250XRN3_9CHLO|nr:hypothetical protein CEUSTIGMA_g13024.t1 [Chlamydomonas eustigma]|eukprot:GAX85609.1 hypothetical protein CEUSTIGMA_g13024.t1 [Chlamydomonas eustigma]
MDSKFIRAVVRIATCNLRLGEFKLARYVADRILDRLSPSSQHFTDVRKKILEIDHVEKQVEEIKEQVCGASGVEMSKEKLCDLLLQVEALHPQVLYSEEMASRALLQLCRYPECMKSWEVTHDGKEGLREAPWRLWIKTQEQGNAAVKSMQLAIAVERYTEALALGGSCAYASLLYSNRAAAHQSPSGRLWAFQGPGPFLLEGSHSYGWAYAGAKTE